MDYVTVRWAGHRQFVGWDSEGHGVVMDSRAAYKGEGTGVRPVELVLYGLAGCAGMDVISVLEKKRQDVQGLEIHVRGRQREDEYPHIYEHVSIEFVVVGTGVSKAAVKRAIELSEDKYCSVKGMLAPQVRVETSFRIVETGDAVEVHE